MTVELIHACAFCKEVFDRATSVDDEGLSPSDGDVSICIKCGEWNIFDASAEGGLRKPVFSEYEEINGDMQMRRLRAAWVNTMRAERRANRRRKA